MTSTQMTLRLSDLATRRIDALVRSDTFDSRSSCLCWSVEREAQREEAWRVIL